MSRFNSLTVGSETTLSVGTTAVVATTGNLDRREWLYLQNDGPEEIKYGPTSSPLALLEVGQFVYLPVTLEVEINLQTASGTSDVVVQEYE